MPKVLPERRYFTLSGLAKSWECTEEDILQDGIHRQLKICVISRGWALHEGYYLDEGSHIPIKDTERCSNKEILQLRCNALEEILNHGEVIDPEFVLVPDQRADGVEYECFLSSFIISQNMENLRGNVIVRKSTLIIRKEDVEAFLAENNDREVSRVKNHDLSIMKRKDREKMVLDYAVQVWEQYQKEHNRNTPPIKYVQDQIKCNPSFAYSSNRPSVKTILKPITEKAVSKEIQSRKSAEKRG